LQRYCSGGLTWPLQGVDYTDFMLKETQIFKNGIALYLDGKQSIPATLGNGELPRDVDFMSVGYFSNAC